MFDDVRTMADPEALEKLKVGEQGDQGELSGRRCSVCRCIAHLPFPFMPGAARMRITAEAYCHWCGREQHGMRVCVGAQQRQRQWRRRSKTLRYGQVEVAAGIDNVSGDCEDTRECEEPLVPPLG